MGYLRTMAVRLYRKFTNRDWGHKCSMYYFHPFGGNSDPVQLMYGRIAYFKYFELAKLGPIHFVWGSIYPWLYASTSTVRIWIDITNFPPTDLITLTTICILYSWCTNIQPISNGLYIFIVGSLGTKDVRLFRNCTNRDWGHKCFMHYLNS